MSKLYLSDIYKVTTRKMSVTDVDFPVMNNTEIRWTNDEKIDCVMIRDGVSEQIHFFDFPSGTVFIAKEYKNISDLVV